MVRRNLPAHLAAAALPAVTLRWDPATEGPLAAVPVAARAFYPGERTTDTGALAATTADTGTPHDGATITLTLPAADLDAALTDGDDVPATVDTLRWLLTPATEAAGGDPFAAPGRTVLTQTRADHERHGLTVRAGLPGSWRLHLELRGRDGRTRQHLVPLSVPRHVPVRCSLALVENTLAAAGIDTAERRATLWAAILDRARPVAAHVLRPLNLRLWWLHDADDDLPAPFTGALTGADQHPAAEHTVVAGDPAVLHGHARRGTITVAGPGVPTAAGAWFGLPHLLVTPEARADAATWAFEPSVVDAGTVRVRLGAPADDAPGSPRVPDVDDVLAHVTARAAAAGFAEEDAATGWWIELNARLVGVAVARAAARAAGATSASAQEVDRNERRRRPGVDLLDPRPADPLRQLLGLHRPQGAPLSAMFTTADGDPAGLAQQQDDPAAHDPLTAWTDLAAYYDRIWQPDADRRAHPAGGRTTRYDVLAGLVLDATLDHAARRLPLPPPYGGHTLTYGDGDEGRAVGTARPRYGGAERPVVTEDDRRHVSDLQFDLRQVGITLGTAPETDETADGVGRFGYRYWARDGSHWDGAHGAAPTVLDEAGRAAHAGQVTAGYTAMSVRELRIADTYPNRVYERLDACPDTPRPRGGVAHREPGQAHLPVGAATGYDRGRHRYGDGLVAVAATARHDPDGTGDVVDDTVVGDLDPLTADRLRRWRFARRRHPITFEACEGAARTTVRAERFMASRGWTSAAERVFVRDLSGYWVAGEENDWQVIGDVRDYLGWSGPHVSAAGHAQTPITERTVLPEGTGDAGRRVFGVVIDSTRPESRGYLDVFNNYDDAITSIPLRHATLALSQGTTDGQFAILGRFLRSTADDLAADVADAADRQRVSLALRAVQQHVLGRFGAVAGELHVPAGHHAATGFMCVPWSEPDPPISPHRGPRTAAGPGPARERAFYQAYAPWFRAWPWLHRLVAAIRTSPRLRAAMYAHELPYLHRMLATYDRRVGGVPVWEYLSSERDLAYALRCYIRSMDVLTGFVAGLDALENARTAWAAHVRRAVADSRGTEEPLVLGPEQEAVVAAHEASLTPAARDGVIFQDDAIAPGPVTGEPAEAPLLQAITDAVRALRTGYANRLSLVRSRALTSLARTHAAWDAGGDTATAVQDAYRAVLAALPDVPLREPAAAEED